MDLILGLVSLLILIYSAILHEIAHGFVAERLGDPTARLMGRLTLNPKNHIDPIMSIALPLILILSGSPVIFGAAKPVPVDPFNFREPKKDMALVSLAGPATNAILAILGAILIKILIFATPYFGASPFLTSVVIPVYTFLVLVVRLNLLLAIFNLIPIPPLDGSKIFALILPDKEAAVYLSVSSIGIFIIFFLLLFPIGGFSLGSLISSLLTFSLHILGL
ncbi:MAG TPA: site-2 protease family protein [Patescibacteria group bacterium]|jgi:Zn-dependent protease|nr:site-2 protease family protein [Patescibacteria group bacterium]